MLEARGRNVWAPAKYAPSMGWARLGQTSYQKTAQAVVEAAEPRLRQIIAEERSRLADVAVASLPYVGLSALTYLVSAYVIEKGSTLKTVGYGVSIGFLALGLWQGIEAIGEQPASAAPIQEEDTGIIGDVVGALVDPASRKLAAAVVLESEPVIREILVEERLRFAEAIETAVPFLGVSVAAGLGTAYLVPEDMSMAKFAGYMVSAGGALYGLYRGAGVVRGEPPAAAAPLVPAA